MSKEIDITGQRFGRLVAIKRVPSRPGSKEPRWLCQCDCGNTHEVDRRGLPLTKSCGCLNKERRQERAAVMRQKGAQRKAARETAAKREKRCPYPIDACLESLSGVCCRQCAEYESCCNACLNTPDKCGFDEGRKED